MTTVVITIHMELSFSFAQCCFSRGGHLFAAVLGNIIQIYSTTTFENVSNMKGHNSKVRCIVWNSDDSKIISCGMDGAVYEWEVLSMRRVSENVLKTCQYSSVALSPDGKTIYAVGSDMAIKEIIDSQAGLGFQPYCQMLRRPLVKLNGCNVYEIYFVHYFLLIFFTVINYKLYVDSTNVQHGKFLPI